MTPKEAASIIPEGHRHPHHRRSAAPHGASLRSAAPHGASLRSDPLALFSRAVVEEEEEEGGEDMGPLR